MSMFLSQVYMPFVTLMHAVSCYGMQKINTFYIKII